MWKKGIYNMDHCPSCSLPCGQYGGILTVDVMLDTGSAVVMESDEDDT